MTESSRLLSELECATMAGVSVETIRQFRGCGLLQAVDEAGTDKFREIDITTLFYNRTKSTNSGTSPQSVAPSSPLREQIITDFVVSSSPRENGEIAKEFAPTSQETTISQAPDKEPESPNPTTDAPVEMTTQTASETPTQESPVEEPSVNETLTSDSTESTSANKLDENPVEHGETTFRMGPEETSTRVIEMLPAQNAINVEYLIEVNKGLREQIDILRGERDWLRNRVEKLETRSEREQMLLLSESENIRKLIQQSENRAFSWLRALPWFKDNRKISN